jgi:hypothetical protein
MWYKDIKILNLIITTLAILGSAYWTYRTFIVERKAFPRAIIEQKTSHLLLSDDVNLIRVNMKIKNTGNTVLESNRATLKIEQILPLPTFIEDKECVLKSIYNDLKPYQTARTTPCFNWKILAKSEANLPFILEPGEEDSIDFEFAVSSRIKVIRIYGYFHNKTLATDPNAMGWETSAYYDFSKSSEVLK